MFLLIMGIFQAQAVSLHAQSVRLTLDFKNSSIEKILSEIESQSEYYFLYNKNLVDVQRKVDIQVKEMAIEDVLVNMFENAGVSYRIQNRQIVLAANESPSLKPMLQSSVVEGKVTDQSGEPLPGVSVVVKGTTQGTVTDQNGIFSLKGLSPGTILIFSFVGMRPVEVSFQGQSSLDIVMQEEAIGLENVVVTALGITKGEKSIGYSVQKIDGEAIQAVKGLNMATSLTGKIAGLTIKNSTELLEKPEITLRGGTPLVVIDEIAYGNMTMNDISAEDVERFDVLKGAAASALYGVRGRNGAIMITTKKGEEGKLAVNVSNNTMFNAGFLKIPKKQTSYASGQIVDGKLNYDADFVWGPYMDGSDVYQYDGTAKDYVLKPLIPRGKNNLENFIENSYITNTNVSVSQAGNAGSFRISASHVYTKGQFPNTKLSKYNLTGAGTIKYGNFKANANFSIVKRRSPNLPERNQYGSGNIIYLMMVWTGADYDIRDFRDYRNKRDETQNWPWKSWYDNPYFIAYEHIYKVDESLVSASTNLSYEFAPFLKAQFRSGYDDYNNIFTVREAVGGVQYKKGYFSISQPSGWSFSNDFLLMSNLKFNDFKFELLGGMGSYYYIDYRFSAATKGGLSIPGFYSLTSSIESPDVSKSEYRKLLYSVYGKAGISYKSMAYLDATGRNDWSSTISSDERSYFYPSVALSFLPSEIYNPLYGALDFLKIRGSWTISKADPGVYDTNMGYTVTTDAWDDFTTAVYPSELSDPGLKPTTENSVEIGTDLRFFKGRLSVDYTYFRKRRYNRIISASVSQTSGFSTMRVNTDEDRVQKGMEISLTGIPVDNDIFAWSASFNVGFDHWYYNKFDEQYSEHDPRIEKGTRTDRYMSAKWQVDKEGELILNNGQPIRDPYTSKLGYTDPKFAFGFSNDFKISDFDVRLSFDGRIGGVMYAQTNQSMWNTGTHPDSDNEYRYNEVVKGEKFIKEGVKVVSGKLVADSYGNIVSDDRVFAENDVAVSYITYTKNYNGNAYTARPQHVVDPTFVKLRELSINYNVPVRLTQKFGCKKATVGCVGQNLFIWTKSKEFKYSDPDRGKDALNSPSIRLIGINANLYF